MKTRRRTQRPSAGFSLIEVLIGIALIGVAMLGLAQLFIIGVWNNRRSEQIITATFVAQQEMDYLRTLTAPELLTLQTNYLDENLDINNDGTTDYRRITQISSPEQSLWSARVLVFPGSMVDAEALDLFNDPPGHKVMSDMYTVIYR
jgi:prepilin-type N-terminal cleavage/methylation domain-containing protein